MKFTAAVSALFVASATAFAPSATVHKVSHRYIECDVLQLRTYDKTPSFGY